MSHLETRQREHAAVNKTAFGSARCELPQKVYPAGLTTLELDQIAYDWGRGKASKCLFVKGSRGV